MTAHGPEHDHAHDEDGYAGPATLLVDGRTLDVEIRLTGCFQPLDGRYHWYGRLAPDARLSALVDGRPVPVTVCTPHGRAEGELRDPDLWQRMRVEGTSTPPFTAMAMPSPEN